ncbi:MAG: MCE family protein [Gemmatimonas sp.]|nr:MCE family protein [Gemmatimonas sp.]
MSLRANPTSIGLFVIGGAVLGVFGIATLATASWFEDQSTFISYFEESVNGLDVGAPVKFQGVPVGRVTELLIQIDLNDKTFQVPVQYEVDLTRLTSATGAFVDLENDAVLGQQIRDGLRAQLQMESIVTGQLYVELAYRTDPAAAELQDRRAAFPEIPSTPSLLAAFGSQAGSAVGDVLQILFRVNEMLEEVDMVELNRSVVASAQAIEDLASSPEIDAALAEAPEMSAQFNGAMAEMQLLAAKLNGTIDPLHAELAGINAEVAVTLKSMQAVIEETSDLITADSGVGYQLEGTLASLTSAADALRALVLSLERNPDMLIRGREANED